MPRRVSSRSTASASSASSMPSVSVISSSSDVSRFAPAEDPREVGGELVGDRARGEVDRHGHVESRGAPAVGVLQRLLDDPQRQRTDQSGVLCQPDELLRREQPSLGVAPAHQRLDAAQRAGRELDLRLEVQQQLAAVDPAAQLGQDREPLEAVLIEVALINDPVPARRLGPVERDVGVTQQRIDAAAMIWMARDPDAGRRCRGPTPLTSTGSRRRAISFAATRTQPSCPSTGPPGRWRTRRRRGARPRRRDRSARPSAAPPPAARRRRGDARAPR